MHLPLTFVVAVLVIGSPIAFGQTAKTASPFQSSLPPGTPTVSLEETLERYRKRTGTAFQIDVRARKEIYAAGTDIDKLDPESLHSLLRSNQLAGVLVGGRLNVIPEAASRQYALPIVQQPETDRPDDEIVTRILKLEHVSAPQMVPILRPLMPQYGHLAAHSDSNSLLIVDRYANVERITEMVLAMDRTAREKTD